MGRLAALLILLAGLVLWCELAPHLDPLSKWPATALVSCVVMPATFALSWIALPFLPHKSALAIAAVAFAAAAVVLGALDAPVVANYAKFGAVTAAGWFFLWAFEALSWVVAVAFLIPIVDSFSVFHGPTQQITENHPHVFTTLSIAFVVPGGNAARLGLPDVLFFSVFLGAAVRFGLRPFWTWFAMLIGLGLTIVGTVVWDTGLPALPAIPLGFLLANCDLLWGRLARRRLRTLED